ncbi:MAG: type II secretion system GspH family protein [Chamaesiphon sp.]|nr:type II secretion system GspH family protein [Chamaesiphon sp.]
MKRPKLDRFSPTDSRSAGFTLVELLVAIAITGIVSTMISYAIGSMVSSNQKLGVEQSRRVEISRALELISTDIQIAQVINPAATVQAAITASNSANAFNPARNSLDTPVLYLELPKTCSGVPERVIYSIRAKSAGEQRFGPNIIYRYGRIANENGNIDCASTPVPSAAIADAITAANITPTCSSRAINSGTNGFYSCVSDNQASIAIFGAVSSANTYALNRIVKSGFVPPVPTASDDCTVPDLLTTPKTPSEANTTILTPSLPYKGLSAAGIATTGGSTVISQTPSAGSKIPCLKGLVTYTY